jgi:hypothetical protein
LAVDFALHDQIIINLNIAFTSSISKVDYKVFVVVGEGHRLDVSFEVSLFFDRRSSCR